MRYQLLPISLCALAFWALFTVAFGVAFAMGLAVTYSDPFYLPWVLVGSALAGLLFACFAAGWKKVPNGASIWGVLALFVLIGLLIIRILFPFFPGRASLVLLGLMEGYGALALGRLRGVTETYLTEQEKGRLLTPLRLSAIAGGVVGGVVAVLIALFLSELSFFWAISLALLISWGLSGLCWRIGLKSSPSFSSAGLKGEVGGWIRLVQGSTSLKWLVSAVAGIYIFRAALVIETLTTYTTLLSGLGREILIFFALLITCSALIGIVSYLIFSGVRRPLGALGANLIYPILATFFTIIWLVFPGSFIGPVLGSVGYLALMPTLSLREVQTSLSLFPVRFAKISGHLVFGFIPLLGIGAGGLLWSAANVLLPPENRVVLLLFLALGSVGLSVGVGLSYRGAFLKNIPFRPSSLTFIDLPKLSKQEIFTFLQSLDPFLQELALKSATREKQALFLPQMEELLAGFLPKEVRFAAYSYLGAVGIGDLLKSGQERVRRRAMAAALFHKAPLSTQTLTLLLEDKSSAIRVMGCALAWQQGLSSSAEQVWKKIDLNALDLEVLCEFIEAVKKPISEHLLCIIKKFAWYPNPKVRREAVLKLGELLEGGISDPDLLEVALNGLASEDPAIREKSIPLLVASNADNRAIHLASCLSDPAPNVREMAGRALADLGEYKLALPFLNSMSLEEIEGAIRVLAWSGLTGEVALATYLEGLLPSTIPFSRLAKTAPINVALNNAHLRVLRRGAVALEARGDDEAAQILRSGRFSRGSLDLLYRLAPRSLIDPVAPLFKDPEREKRSDTAFQHDLKILAKSEDPFIKKGAYLALNNSEDDEMNRLIFLKSLSYFQDLLLEEVVLLSSHLEQEEYLKGEVIFEEGSVGGHFYLIYKGQIDLLHGDKPLAQLKEGEGFGEMALFEEQVRSATAKAGEDTILLALEKAHFHELIRLRPAILLEICKKLGERLRKMDKQFSLISS